jgi:hypothetical protein
VLLISIAAIGGFLCLACIVGFVVPTLLTRLVPWFLQLPGALAIAVAVRIAIGVALIVAAPDTRYPFAFQILGGLMLLAAAVLPLLGIARITRLVNWVAGWPPLAMRAWLVLGFAFGAFLVYGIGLV